MAAGDNRNPGAFALLQRALPSIFLAGGIIALIAVGVILILPSARQGDATFNFIALVIIFMVALTLAGAVFQGLKLADEREAFGLPAGSVRTLLAIGVMILFVVFGLPMVSGSAEGPERLSEQPIQTIRIDPPNFALVRETVEQSRRDGLTAIVTNYGVAAVPPAPAVPAQIDIYAKTKAPTADQADFNKQLLTALITLLTSVVSFYFGSRSATEGMRETAAGQAAGPAATLNLDRRRLGERFELLDDEVAKVGKAIDDLRAAAPPTDPQQAAARTDGLARASVTRQAIEARRDEVKRLLQSLETALTTLAAATTDNEKQAQESSAREQLQQATSLLAALEQAQASYASEVAAIP